jgi:GntR family transcriptional repressor for pyruvate dehydrogenase complex
MKAKGAASLNTPVGQNSIVNLVIERIKEAILTQELRPGDYLPTETELVTNLGVSKTSVREAVKMLQAQGVVEVQRGRGTKISENLDGNVIAPLIYQLLLARGKIQEIIDFRMMFEEAYTIMAMDRATSEDIARVAATVDDLELAITENRQTAMEDLAFHLEILRSTHNPLVIRVGETIMDLFKVSIGYSVTHHPEIALRDHKQILDAFCQKNKSKLREVIQGSFEAWRHGLEMTKQQADEAELSEGNLEAAHSKAASRRASGSSTH